MDITSTTEPKSDQQNFEDYIGGPKTVTVSEVKKGSAEQPVEVHLHEYPGRPFKPSKSMRRVLVAAWGAEASVWAGRRITLYGDPEVKFGGQTVGGIRISHLSHLSEPLKVLLTVTRGKRAPVIVQPLTDAPTIDPAPYLDALKSAATIDALKQAWQAAADAGIGQHPDVLTITNVRKAELTPAVEAVEIPEAEQ